MILSRLIRRSAIAAAAILVAFVPLAAQIRHRAVAPPSNITVTCGADTQRATVTVQLMSGVTNPSPSSNQLVLACSASSPVATGKIAPLTQPAAAYSWSAFVTATTSTFGCGGTTPRGTTATCTNAAGGSGVVTVLAT